MVSKNWSGVGRENRHVYNKQKLKYLVTSDSIKCNEIWNHKVRYGVRFSQVMLLEVAMRWISL